MPDGTTPILRTLIVDDERLARERLIDLLKDHPNIHVTHEAEDVDSAAIVLMNGEIDLIFLDIQMPGASGFELFERCRVEAQVVFVTAHDEYAVRAFEVNALDYLLKPVAPERLATALKRLQTRTHAISNDAIHPKDKICLRDGTGLTFVGVNDIAAIRADGDYCDVCLTNRTRHFILGTLSSFEKRLVGTSLVRIHRGAMINLTHVEELTQTENGYCARVTGVEEMLSVSRRRLPELRRALKGDAQP